ncbi:hypothetical protein KAR10_00105, partial [bacterium]|nr:hypothetical protein [bacterium]
TAQGSFLGQLLEDPVDRQLKKARAKYYSTPKQKSVTEQKWDLLTPEQQKKEAVYGKPKRPSTKAKGEKLLISDISPEKIFDKAIEVSILPRVKQGKFDDWYGPDAYEQLKPNFISAAMELGGGDITEQEAEQEYDKIWDKRTGGWFFQEYMPREQMKFGDSGNDLAVLMSKIIDPQDKAEFQTVIDSGDEAKIRMAIERIKQIK